MIDLTHKAKTWSEQRMGPRKETYIGRSKGVNPFWIFDFGFGTGKSSGEQRTVSD
jgi:hypothetical protein